MWKLPLLAATSIFAPSRATNSFGERSPGGRQPSSSSTSGQPNDRGSARKNEGSAAQLHDPEWQCHEGRRHFLQFQLLGRDDLIYICIFFVDCRYIISILVFMETKPIRHQCLCVSAEAEYAQVKGMLPGLSQSLESETACTAQRKLLLVGPSRGSHRKKRCGATRMPVLNCGLGGGDRSSSSFGSCGGRGWPSF